MNDVHGNTMVTDEELLAAFDRIEGPYVTATELEEVLPIGRTAITKRLKTLYDDGRVNKKQPIPHMIGWWRCEEYEHTAPDEIESVTD